MKNKFRKIKSCRLCESDNLHSFIDFGSVPLGNNLQKNLQDSSMADEFPLHVIRCSKCGHLQLDTAVKPKLLYATNYTYLSGIGKSFLKHINEYVSWIEKKNRFNNHQPEPLEWIGNEIGLASFDALAFRQPFRH